MKNQDRFNEAIKWALQTHNDLAAKLREIAARTTHVYRSSRMATGRSENKPAGSKLKRKSGQIGMGIHARRYKAAYPAPSLMGASKKAARKRFYAS